jgi:hypothetical protein
VHPNTLADISLINTTPVTTEQIEDAVQLLERAAKEQRAKRMLSLLTSPASDTPFDTVSAYLLVREPEVLPFMSWNHFVRSERLVEDTFTRIFKAFYQGPAPPTEESQRALNPPQHA